MITWTLTEVFLRSFHPDDQVYHLNKLPTPWANKRARLSLPTAFQRLSLTPVAVVSPLWSTPELLTTAQSMTTVFEPSFWLSASQLSVGVDTSALWLPASFFPRIGAVWCLPAVSSAFSQTEPCHWSHFRSRATREEFRHHVSICDVTWRLKIQFTSYHRFFLSNVGN